MQAAARHLRLELTARLRRLGWLPWALLVGWGVVAQAQEPKMLRGFGVVLGPQAMWVAATILLCALFTADRRVAARSPRTDLLTNVTLLAVLALAQSLLSAGIETVISGRASVAVLFGSAASFVLAWLPLACSCAGSNAVGSRFWMQRAIIAAAGILGVAIAVGAWRHGCDLRVLAGSLLGGFAGLTTAVHGRTQAII